MPCESIGYIVQNGNRWKAESSGSVQSAKHQKHAEIQVLDKISYKPGPYLIVQDAFPCFDKCHAYFLNISKSTSKPAKKKGQTEIVSGTSVIIKVTADNTKDMDSYVAEGLVNKIGCFPWYIYYKDGAATFTMGIAIAPGGFPVHPSPQNI